ncbi:DUF4124 domain-containing protein [Massilia sp. H6]|uniref:DUF4124 domain-containing protein n=1 Tax=Massilia sp. H6 TaxID=2970464 RepID=UPI002168C8C5|nr:DUF4124 domain-containing protein [Massilia sp. H6]UVW27521.1 DUF4124 domain-containing protein [Massilia sp. H6]
MKRHLCLSLIIAATTLTAPGAFAGSEIVKCVDGAGHVTLTDQACDSAAATVRLARADVPSGADADADAGASLSRADVHPPASEQRMLPPPPVHRSHLAPRVKARPLMRDVATLKAARAQFLMLDAAPRQRLATLD